MFQFGLISEFNFDSIKSYSQFIYLQTKFFFWQRTLKFYNLIVLMHINYFIVETVILNSNYYCVFFF